MARNVTQQLIESHLVSGRMVPGEEIGLHIDQALTQDATGTLVMLELEAFEIERVVPEPAVQYVDHNLLQADSKNAEDHLFLQSAAQRFGFWFSRPGNGVSHPLHMERFGVPGKTLVGSDSHTPAAGALGMLSFGAGGLDVAFALLGEPLFLAMPRVFGVRLMGHLPDWLSAKDIVLEMLRRYDVDGCRGMIVEYYGEGLADLSAMDRHVLANMGTELGATTTVFPSDQRAKSFLEHQGRAADWVELQAEPGCQYDLHEEIDLSSLEPLIACPSSPGNVVKVRELEELPVHQVVVGSSANPGFRDFWVVGEIVRDKVADTKVSFDINPTTRRILQQLIVSGSLAQLTAAGARLHQAGCMGCIGMGQAPAAGKISLRTMPRNFPGRSGTLDDQVYLCSPETAAAAALTGRITDPRKLEELHRISYPRFSESLAPKLKSSDEKIFIAPLPAHEAATVTLVKGPNIRSLPILDELENKYSLPVLLKLGNNISTDEILRAGAEVLPFRSNIERLSDFAFTVVDETFPRRAIEAKQRYGGHVIVAGDNYAQGSSREHAALVPRFLGEVLVIARSYARIGWQNLVNFGVLPLIFVNPEDYEDVAQGAELNFERLRDQVAANSAVSVLNVTSGKSYELKHNLSDRQREIVLAGGAINYYRLRSKYARRSRELKHSIA